MRLCHRKQLSLQTKVFPEIFEDFYDYSVCPGSELITVEHLLDHTTGCWPTTTRAEDPVFNQIGLPHSKLIQHVLNETKVIKEPGTNFVYSNFGYLLLGRIIEFISGKSYIDFIRDMYKTEILVAGSTQSQLHQNESHYYSRDQDDCYNMPLQRMDSCAGLIISPEDLITRVASSLQEDVN